MGYYRKLFIASLLGVAIISPVQARSVTDDQGQSVTLSENIERIAEAWYAHQTLLMTLGVGPKIVATVNNPRARQWMFKVLPLPAGTALEHGDTFSAESLLTRKTDVVFISTSNPRVAQTYSQAGIPTVQIGFTDLPSLQRSLTTTALVLNTPQAQQRAAAYNAYLDKTLQEVLAITTPLTDTQRPRVLHIASLNPLQVDGSNTLIDYWIKAAGGRNAAQGLQGNMQAVSAEQLLAWQPDVIILAANAGSPEAVNQHALLRHLPAVQRQHVLRNPEGVFPWDRYGTESALQIQWAVRQLHPELFPQLDMVKRTIEFYQQFFDYALTPADAQRILDGLPPAS